MTTSDDYFQLTNTALQNIDRQQLTLFVDQLFAVWNREGTIYLLGNGGAATLASHMAGDLMTCTDGLDSSKGKAVRATSLTDNQAVLTAIGNDFSYDEIFTRQLATNCCAKDLVIAISGSGNSSNILAAADWCKANQVACFSLTGYDGGQLLTRSSNGLHVDSQNMGIVQSLHMLLFHWAIEELRIRIDQTVAKPAND